MHIFPRKHPGDISKFLPKPSLAPAGIKNKIAQPLSFTPLTKFTPVKSGNIPQPNLIHRVLSKMTFGPKDSEITHINNLPGGDDMSRILAYIDEQLEPENIDDSALEAIINQGGWTTFNKSQQELFQEHFHKPDGSEIQYEDHIKPGRETTYAVFTRSLHSKRQLFEMMTDFWHNHFNVYMDTDKVPPMFVHYDRDVIRPEALGNFRNMMYEVTRANCMLSYLGNGVNEQSAPNENYARELLELHTIGAKNYLGHMPWQDVPTDGEGRRLGYVEADVLELARALTGWSFSGAVYQDYQYLNDTPIDLSQAPTGLFMFRPEWHDEGIKRVMGQDFLFDSNQPQKDMNDILDMLAEHPATAEFLAHKLCQRFIADEPDQTTVQQVADTLHQNWQAPDQIKLAMEVLLKSNAFLTTWGEKIKRPFERSIGAMRLINYDYNFDPADINTSSYYWGFRDTGQVPFLWTSPNGYPDTKAHWLSASSTMATWRYTQWFGRLRSDANNNPTYGDIIGITENALTPDERTAEGLVNFWYEKICGFTPTGNTYTQLVNFMSFTDINDPQPGSTDTPIDIYGSNWPDYPQERLLALVSTILMTTSFIYR